MNTKESPKERSLDRGGMYLSLTLINAALALFWKGVLKKRRNNQVKQNIPSHRTPIFRDHSFPSVTVNRRHMAPPRHSPH